MLVRHRGALPLALVCLVLLLAAPAAADLGTKLDRAKSLDREGYQPTTMARRVQVAEVEPNDTPETAQAIAAGDVVDAAVGAGDVDWFAVDATGLGFAAVSTTSREGSLTDTLLEVFASDASTLLGSDDDGGVGLFSALRGLAVPVDGVLLVRVTRFSPLGDDAYALVVESDDAPPAPPANDSPVTATVLEGCNGVVEATTVGATSSIGALPCVAPDPLGGDVFYRIELPYSFQLTVQVEPVGAFDPSAYLFTDPQNPIASCVAGVDEAFAGEVETLLFTNESESGEAVILYLAVDGWDPQRSGEFVAAISCDFVVSNDQTSFGALKARF